MKNLFLDDERFPKNVGYRNSEWHIVRNYNDFVKYILNEDMPEIISFDHDLGTRKTGMDCLNFLLSTCLDREINLPRTYFHTANPIGAANMRSAVENFDRAKKIFKNN